MTKASDNVFPKVILDGVTSAPSAPANDNWKVYAMPDGVYARSSNTIVGPFGASGGAVATDAIWDAAGDLAVGSGANTAARLAIGAAGGAVSRINGAVAWNSGTSFPGSVATGDRYWRTDLAHEYYYDGTRWLTVEEFTLPWTTRTALGGGITVTSTIANAATRGAAGDIYVTTMRAATFVNTTNDGTKYWDITLDKIDAAAAATTIGTCSTVSNATGTWIEEVATINAVVVGATYPAMRLLATLVSTAGSMVCGVVVKYREIAT